MEIGNRRKGQVNMMWIIGALAVVIAPMIIGMLLSAIELPAIAYTLIGYVVLLFADFMIARMLFKIPVIFALVVGIVLPFLQASLVMFAV